MVRLLEPMQGEVTMTPKEKWERLQHPTCAADYGLGISEKELRTFPEGRALMRKVDQHRRLRSGMSELCAKLGSAARTRLERDVIGSL